jgi:hypothetical protein
VLESISLDIANYWTSNDFLTESNKNCGTLVAFDWREKNEEYYLTEINTNIDLGKLESKDFKFDTFVDFLNKNNFTFVLGLRNIVEGPDKIWINKFKEVLKVNGIDYDEYIVDRYPTPIPEFDIPDNVFILRYSFDPHNQVDEMAAVNILFEDFIKKSDWEKCYKNVISKEKTRVIVLYNNIENLVLKDGFSKNHG